MTRAQERRRTEAALVRHWVGQAATVSDDSPEELRRYVLALRKAGLGEADWRGILADWGSRPDSATLAFLMAWQKAERRARRYALNVNPGWPESG